MVKFEKSPGEENSAESTLQDLDNSYVLLTQLHWRGIPTNAIEWHRKGPNAVAKFGTFDDAPQFVAYLDFGNAIKKQSSVRSMADQVKFPQAHPPWGTPVEIEIPLAIIDIIGLQKILDQQRRERVQPAAPAQDLKI